MANTEAPSAGRAAPERPKAESRFPGSPSDPPESLADDPLLNTTLSRTYRVTRVIGEGGMGRVYEAWHTRIKKKRYAIKVLHPEYARSPEVLSRFQREAEAAASVSHPNAIGVYDVALTPAGSPYLVCDYLEGIDLSAHIKSKAPLPTETALHIALQVCDALIEAHANGVVHRDLKPQNVFLVGDFSQGIPERPNAKVLDFGLSRFLEASDSELTKTGVVMGTPSYMAPEQARGERADHRCDVYGVGALLFAMLTGRPPFKTETPQATVLAVMNDEPPRPTSLNPKIPASLEFIIQHAMARDPQRRYSDMKALRAAIAEFAQPGRPALESFDASSSAQTQVLGARVPSSRDREMDGVRLRFVVVGTLSTLAALAAVSAAVAGAITLAFGSWPLTRMETVLTLLIIVGTLLTPCLLLLRKLRKTIWENTARVFAVLVVMRESARAGMFAYGAGALAWLFIDNVLLHFVDAPALGTNSGLRWPGTPIVLLGAALVLYLGKLLATRLDEPDGWVMSAKADSQYRLRQVIAGPLMTALTLGAGLSVLALGTLWRAQSSGVNLEHATATREASSAGAGPVPAAPHADPPTPSTPPTSPQLATSDPKAAAQAPADAAAAPSDAGTTPASAPTELAIATNDELNAAIAEGVDGLQLLAERRPNDPRVLRALAIGQASRSATLVAAIGTLSRLFTLSPQLVKDEDLQRIVIQVTRVQGPEQSAALDLLASRMGSVGPDLLYKIAHSQPKERTLALRTLARPAVRARFSPALSVAYELQFAESCAARVTLLERAAQLGDDRAIRVLTPLATPPANCSKKPCAPTCVDEAKRYLDTVNRISRRLSRAD